MQCKVLSLATESAIRASREKPQRTQPLLFRPVFPTLCRLPASLLAEIRSGRRLAYPAGKGSEAIRRTMLPNSRRIRWLSASNSQ